MRDARGKQPHRCQFFGARSLGLRNAQFLRPLLHLLLQRVTPFAQLRLGISQRRGHGVERGRQLAELVRTAHRNRLVQISGSQPLGPRLQVAQGHVDQAMHEETHAERGN